MDPAHDVPDVQEDAMIGLLRKELQDLNQTTTSFRFRWWAWPVAAIAGFVASGFGALAFTRATGEEQDAVIGGMAFLG
ncbi:MAG: hypothetical protein HY047_09090, partial [Acidobacteria bacterium]|nr:hypothetical protein [Acidobacteriota bacterium]